MSQYGKPDVTGRSSGKFSAKDKKLYGPPRDEPWVWETAALLYSPAWRALGINARRLIDFLKIEHRNHAGRENGNLQATYDQLVAYGLPRNEIRAAIEEAEFLGLLHYRRGGRWADTNQPSTYCLTFYADRFGNPQTNEWKGKTEETIQNWKAERAQMRRNRKTWKKQNPGTTSRTTAVRLPGLPNLK